MKDWHTIPLEINPDPRVQNLGDCILNENDTCSIEKMTGFFDHTCGAYHRVLGALMNLTDIDKLQRAYPKVCLMRVPWYMKAFNLPEHITMNKTLGNIFKETYHESFRLSDLLGRTSLVELINDDVNKSSSYSSINNMTTPNFLSTYMKTSLEGLAYIAYASEENNDVFTRVKNSIANLKSKKVHEWPQMYTQWNMTSTGLWLLQPGVVFSAMMGHNIDPDGTADYVVTLYVAAAEAYRRRTLTDVMSSYNIDMPYLKQKTVHWISAELLGLKHFNLTKIQSATSEENEAFKHITFADVAYFQKGASITAKSVMDLENELKPMAGTARFMSTPLENLASESSRGLDNSTLLQFADALPYVNSTEFVKYVSEYNTSLSSENRALLEENLKGRSVSGIHRLFDLEDHKDPRKMSLTEILPDLTVGK